MANIINFNDKDKQDKTQQSGSQQGTNISPVSNFNAQQSVQKPASSGQFTNIQKYLQANQGAGQQVAGAVSGQLDKSLKPGQRQQQEASNKFAENVQKSRDVLGKGQGFLQQMQQPAQQAVGLLGQQKTQAQQQTQASSAGPQTQAFADSPVMTAEQAMAARQPEQQVQSVQPVQAQAAPNVFSAQSFVSDPNQLKEFTQLRTGQAIDENMLRQLASSSQALAGLTQQQAQELSDRAKSAQGRTSLISQTYNRPNYTQGQQRLDSLFLTGAGRQGINALQNKANENLLKAQQTKKASDEQVTTGSDIATQEETLKKALQGRANELESSYLEQLKGQVGGINEARQKEQARAANFFNTLVGKNQGQTLDQDLFNELQLRAGEQTFNVLNDPNLTKEQVFRFSQQQAKNAQDAATQQDVDYYKALAQLSKGQLDESGQFVAPRADELALTQASQLDKAVSALQGENSLRNRLTAAQEDFIKKAAQTNITGYGEDKGTSNIFGSGGTAGAQASINLKEFLNSGGGVNTIENMIAQNPGLSRELLSIVNPLAAVPGADTAINSLISTGQSSGSSQAATQRAQMDLVNNLYNSLIGQGYGNVLTTSGNKNIDNLLRTLGQQDVDKAEVQNRSEYNILDPSRKNDIINSIAGNIINSRTRGGRDQIDNYMRDRIEKDAVEQAQRLYQQSLTNAQNEYNTKMNENQARRQDVLSQIKNTLGLNWNLNSIPNKYGGK